MTICAIGQCSFFFSSRRRHTRCLSDWSSDVCSSDLTLSRTGQLLRAQPEGADLTGRLLLANRVTDRVERVPHLPLRIQRGNLGAEGRSEERRVGKECRTRWWTQK